MFSEMFRYLSEIRCLLILLSFIKFCFCCCSKRKLEVKKIFLLDVTQMAVTT